MFLVLVLHLISTAGYPAGDEPVAKEVLLLLAALELNLDALFGII